jgi:hypothetical protein
MEIGSEAAEGFPGYLHEAAYDTGILAGFSRGGEGACRRHLEGANWRTKQRGDEVMAVRVKPITLWRTEVDNQAGALAATLEPLAEARADLQAVMGYRLPGDRARAAIEVYPVSGARATSAAQAAGLGESRISALHIEGDNRPGVGHAIARALGDAGINMDFLIGLVCGGRHATVIGFDSAADADRAVPLIKSAAGAQRRSAGRKTARKRAGGGRKKASRKASRRR